MGPIGVQYDVLEPNSTNAEGLKSRNSQRTLYPLEGSHTKRELTSQPGPRHHFLLQLLQNSLTNRDHSPDVLWPPP